MSLHMKNIKSKQRIFLQNSRTSTFIGIPQNSTGSWDAAKASVTPSPHIIEIINSDSDILRNGDTVTIKGTFTNYPDYNTIYPSPNGWVWYDKETENQPKQQWKIIKENHQDIREPIYHGDSVYLSNVYYNDALLYEDNGYIGISYETVDKWNLTISKI